MNGVIEQNFLDHLDGQLGQHQDIARSIMESISDVVFFVSLSGSLEYVSPSGKRNLGFTESDIIGKPFESFIHPNDIPACR